MSTLLPWTVHVRDGVFLEEPERVYIECNNVTGQWMGTYRFTPLSGSQFQPLALEEIGCPTIGRKVIGSTCVDVLAYTIVVDNHNLGNKYFTRELFNRYLRSWCCGECVDCCKGDTEFLLLNGCLAKVNGQGLLI